MRRRKNAHRPGGRWPGMTTGLALVGLVLVSGCSGALRTSDRSSKTTTSATIAAFGAVGVVAAADTTAAAAALADGAASPATNPPSTAVPDAAADA